MLHSFCKVFPPRPCKPCKFRYCPPIKTHHQINKFLFFTGDALRPEFILADEIVSGLDVSSQAQVLHLLEDLVKELGLTLAFISHDLSVIRRLCDNVMVLHRGEIVEMAPTAEIFAAPQNDYTRRLLDAIPLPDPDQPNWHH